MVFFLDDLYGSTEEYRYIQFNVCSVLPEKLRHYNQYVPLQST